MRDYLCIGPSPPDEECYPIGDYRAKAECRRYIDLIREVLGPEPEGARLAIKGFDHDIGVYYIVICYYTLETVDYAFKVEIEGPTKWNDAPSGGILPNLTL